MKKHTKRKVYPLIDVMAHVKAGLCVTPEAQLDKLRMIELSAIDSLSKGRGTKDDWNCVNALLNTTELIAKTGIGSEALPVCALVEVELRAANKRFNASNLMTVTDTGLSAFRELFRYHDAQRTAISRGTYEQKIYATMNGMRRHVPALDETQTKELTHESI